ncbi:MAG: transcriptional regulator [Clostridiales bacterium]|jgi:hypothetical protein|nr:transcriptional regulator [Clostridiales bacterium]
MRKWSDIRHELFTTEEIRESDLRVSIIGEAIKARDEKKISQKELNNLDKKDGLLLEDALRILAPLGKTLAVVAIND